MQQMVSWCYLTSVSSDINLVLRQIYLGIKFSIKKNTGIVQNRKSVHDKWSSVEKEIEDGDYMVTKQQNTDA